MSSEASIQQRIRLLAARLGVALWRNNVGAFLTPEGRPVRYGLANDSSALNKEFKSADLIGILPVTIGPEHVGKTIGVFVSIECKRSSGGVVSKGQKNWSELVKSRGGMSIITNNPEEVQEWLSQCQSEKNTGSA